MSVLISAERLRKTYGEKAAVEDVSLQVKAGEIYGLVGSDGAGKTTTLRLLVGALKPDSGSAAICGIPVGRRADEARSHIGYLSQRFSLYEDLTVLENIRFFAEVRGLRSQEWQPRCMEILEFVGLASFKDRRAGQLSGGMKQKLGLASALVTRPEVLLLDEPTTGVDPVTRQDFWQLIIKLVSALGDNETGGRAVLITTPYMDEAARCHRIGFMRAGQIIAEGTPAEIRKPLEGRILEVRGSPLPLLRQVAYKIKGVEDVRLFGDKLHLRLVDDQTAVVPRLLAELIPAEGGSLAGTRLVPPSLEDVFIALSEENG
jgi:ABC-2 type transport system ATP-binding protein